MRNILFLILFFFTFLFLFQKPVFAESNSFVTIVNPQRISAYTENYLASFKAEYTEIKKRNLPATWPVTYDVLLKSDFTEELKNMDSNQELGLFLEVSPELCHDAGVVYNKTDSWHRATSLFLSGYSQPDRKKLIDTVFMKFKETFGYYPVSVGAWWVDSYSLSYMKQKYGITGVLGMSDQYDLDGYALWGSWWSIPYYPSKINAAIPAQDQQNKLDIVTFRWAARDPLNGYNNTNNERKQPSLYSVQDYSTIGLSDSYVSSLIETFAIKKPENKFGQITIGLEGDLNPNEYKNYFNSHLDIVALKNTRILAMKDFSEWYRNSFPDLSPNHLVYSDDLLEGPLKSYWFQSPFYRIGINYNTNTQQIKIFDLRSYFKNLQEPNFLSPNKDLSLSVNLPFIVDSVVRQDSEIVLNFGSFENIENSSLIFQNGNIELGDKDIIIQGNLDFPNLRSKISALTLEKKDSKTILHLGDVFPVAEKGLEYNDYSFTIPFAVKRRFPFPVEYAAVGIIVAAALTISFFKKRGIIALFVFILLIVILSIIISPNYRFIISQDEYNALQILKALPPGNVLTYDKDCLNCTTETRLKPAAMAGKKGYVSMYSQKPTNIDFAFQVSKTSAQARKILKDKNIRYIYLAKYESYIELLPYLPQDLGLTRIYSSANAEIWKVK